MRVAVLTRHFPNSINPWGGHSTFQTLRLLAQRCDLHVFHPICIYPKMLADPKKPLVDMTWRPKDIELSYVPYRGIPGLSRPVNSFTISRRAFSSIRDFRPDVILNYYIYPEGTAAVRIAHTLKVPVVLTAVGSDINRIPDPLCGFLTRSAIRGADFISTVSSDLRIKTIAMGGDPTRTRTKLNGCDTAVFYPQDQRLAREALGLEADKEILLYVGRMDRLKGLCELVEAVARLVPQRPNLHCYMVGNGADTPVLRELMATHNVTKQITIIPACGTAQVAQWMAAANIVTLPSYFEGCPNVVIEALAAGRPVVATSIGGISELMDDTCGYLVPARDVSALTQALDDALNATWDPASISSKHSRGWSDVADDLYQVLEETIERSRFNKGR